MDFDAAVAAAVCKLNETKRNEMNVFYDCYHQIQDAYRFDSIDAH